MKKFRYFGRDVLLACLGWMLALYGCDSGSTIAQSETCEDGEEQGCFCSDTNAEGVQTCEDGAWGDCGCGEAQDDDDDTTPADGDQTDDDDDSTGTDGDVSYTDGDADFADAENVEVVESEFSISVMLSTVIPTVATVTWSVVGVSSLDEAYIEFGEVGAGYRMTAPTDVTGSSPYETVLFGMKPSRETHFRIVARQGEELYRSEDQSFVTGDIPRTLPALSTQTTGTGSHAEGFLLTTLFATPGGAIIIDKDGEYVWWYLPSGSNLQLSRARMSPDHRWVYMWSTNVKGGGAGGAASNQNLIRVSIDGTDVSQTPLPNGHHDFTILPDGTIAYIEYDNRTVSGRSVSGDRLMEISLEGQTKEVYSVWEDFTYSAETSPMAGEGWCHANSLEYIADKNVYYMGSKTWGSILKIDRASGSLLDVFGGSESSYTVSTGGTTPYQNQHNLDLRGNNLLVFNNGSEQTRSTTAVEYELDATSNMMTLVWSYTPSPNVFNFTLGDVQFIGNDNRMVLFSTSGLVDEVDADGRLVWRLSMALGGALGYGVWKESLYE